MRNINIIGIADRYACDLVIHFLRPTIELKTRCRLEESQAGLALTRTSRAGFRRQQRSHRIFHEQCSYDWFGHLRQIYDHGSNFSSLSTENITLGILKISALSEHVCVPCDCC